MILKRTSGICIPRDLENEVFYTNIKDNLTRKFYNYGDSTIFWHNFYVEDSKIFKIPRFFPIWDYTSCKIENSFGPGEDIKINHNIKLRDDLQKNIVEYLLENNRGIIQASPGSGKTVTGVFAVAERKKKSFILVHRDSLADQWKGPGTKDKKQGFLAFTDLKDNEVVRLTSANFEDALTKPVIICTDQTFISLLKRHRARFLISLNKANIGIFIADEVHTTVGAPTFAECSIHIPSPISFGFSATPYRYDGNGDVIEYHLGEVFEPEGTATVMDARVTVMLFDYGITKKSFFYVYWAGRFQRARYFNLLRKSEMLTVVSKSLLTKFLKDDRDIVYVTERLNHIDMLHKWAPTDNKTTFISGDKIDVLDCQLVFSTPGKMRDGVDIPQKDCLIMSTPISNIEQMCGRIVRISRNKEEPIIIDMVDIGEKEIYKTLFSRVKYYEKKKWKVKYVLLTSDGTFREISKDNAMEIISEKNE
jgi:superfamily II DNA or RNA helicase